MKGTSKWAHRQGKRGKAVAYGCYLPDDEPNPLDIDRDAAEVEKREEAERRAESKEILRSIKKATRGRSAVGEWEPYPGATLHS